MHELTAEEKRRVRRLHDSRIVFCKSLEDGTLSGVAIEEDQWQFAHEAGIAVDGEAPELTSEEFRALLPGIPVDQARCDFCSAQPVVWSFEARDLQLPTPVPLDKIGVPLLLWGGSSGNWAACAQCKLHVRRGDREALLERSVDRMFSVGIAQRIPRTVLSSKLREVQDTFWANREGVGYELKPGMMLKTIR